MQIGLMYLFRYTENTEGFTENRENTKLIYSFLSVSSLKSLKVKILYKPSKFSNAVFFLSVFTSIFCKHRQKEHRIIYWFEAQFR